MPLQDVVDAVAARMGGAPVLIGKKHLSANGAPPRLVFVPNRDRIVAPERIGGNPPAIHTCWSGVQVHVWGADVGSTEALRNQLLVALRDGIKTLTIEQITANGYRVGECGWLDSGWASSGEVWVGHFEFGFPVAPTAAPTKVVTSIPQINQLETPGNPPTEEDAG